MQLLTDLFGIKDFIPHGYCLSWSPILLWLHVISDVLITLAYYSIPITLIYFTKQRKAFPYPWLLILFAGFIVACGSTHLLSVVTIWIPLYWLDGLLKACTAIISVTTAVLMVWIIPRVLSLPGAKQLQVEIEQRKVAEEALRESENKLSTILDSVEACIYIKDKNYQYQYANLQTRQMLGKTLTDSMGESDDAFFDEVTLAQLRENDRRILEKGERIAAEETFTYKDKNSTRTYLSIKQPLCNEDGAIYGLCGISTDISERKQMEEKLRNSKAFNVSILNSLTSHIAVLNERGVIIAVNKSWRQFARENSLLESSPDALGFNYLEECKKAFSQPCGDDATAAHIGIAAVLAGERETFDFEYVCHSAIQQRWFHMRVSPLQGSRRGVVVNHENITGRKEMETKLRTSEAKFRSIIEASPVPMALNDELLRITYLNPAFVQTFGYTLDDIPTLADWRLKAYPDPAYRQWVRDSWQEGLGNPKLELAVRCKNNRIKTVIASAAEIYPSFTGERLAVFYDITQRKQIEAKLNAIFDAAVEGIITIDMADTIVSLNTAVETIFGYGQEELIGCGISKLIPPFLKEMADQSELLDSQIRELEGVHKMGHVVPLDMSIAKYSVDDANYITYIVRDVSLRKCREQQNKAHLDQLAHVTRLGLMGEMASGIAHEVNQPLTAVSVYTQVSLNLIKAENTDLVKLNEVLHKTQQQALRAGRIIHRMREFVKSHIKNRSPADINALIHEAVNLCIAELKENNVKLTTELENKPQPVLVDQTQIEQVLINLIRNSVEALKNLPIERQRLLSIHSILSPDKTIQVRIKDNGPGISDEQKQHILMPFYTTKADGMGMGLSICRSLIEAHQGSLRFNSEYGKGSTFYFTLPLQEASFSEET